MPYNPEVKPWSIPLTVECKGGNIRIEQLESGDLDITVIEQDSTNNPRLQTTVEMPSVEG